MKKKRRGSRLPLILIALLVPSLAFTAHRTWSILRQSDREQDAFKDLAAQVAQAGGERSKAAEPDGGSAPASATSAPDGQIEVPGDPGGAIEYGTIPAEPPREVLPEYRGLYEQNEDFFGWLAIDDTPIDYPVMFTPWEPERYLHRDFYGEYSYSGTPFVEGSCAEQGRYYIIYAHHMKDGTMFGTLPRYAEADYCAEHPVIRFDTLYERRAYRVVAAFKSRVYGEGETGAFRYYEFNNLSDPERFQAYMDGVMSCALYDTGVRAAFGDELLALSTCNYHTANGRFVVVAKRITDEETPASNE